MLIADILRQTAPDDSPVDLPADFQTDKRITSTWPRCSIARISDWAKTFKNLTHVKSRLWSFAKLPPNDVAVLHKQSS
jgi:hypothetical protein